VGLNVKAAAAGPLQLISSTSSLSSWVGWLCQVLEIYIACVCRGFGRFDAVWGLDRALVGEGLGGGAEESNLVVSPAASLRPSAERKASATLLIP
jgi:hypothetical protein